MPRKIYIDVEAISLAGSPRKVATCWDKKGGHFMDKIQHYRQPALTNWVQTSKSHKKVYIG